MKSPGIHSVVPWYLTGAGGHDQVPEGSARRGFRTNDDD
jgi:hypothetical protein